MKREHSKIHTIYAWTHSLKHLPLNLKP